MNLQEKECSLSNDLMIALVAGCFALVGTFGDAYLNQRSAMTTAKA